MTDVKDSICLKCKHYRIFDIGCDAFPEGIPNEILLKNKHDKPLPEQDNDLVYEPGDLDEMITEQMNELSDEDD